VQTIRELIAKHAPGKVCCFNARYNAAVSARPLRPLLPPAVAGVGWCSMCRVSWKYARGRGEDGATGLAAAACGGVSVSEDLGQHHGMLRATGGAVPRAAFGKLPSARCAAQAAEAMLLGLTGEEAGAARRS
jgi:hypothetical protein